MSESVVMNEYEYEFMTGKWEGPKGAAYNSCYEFCLNEGWIMGWSDHDEPIPTQAGINAMKKYVAGQKETRDD